MESSSPRRNSRIQRGTTFVKLAEKADKIYEFPTIKNRTPYRNVSKKELLRYVTYTIVFFFVISMQIDIKETSNQNRSVQRLFYPTLNMQTTSKSISPTQDFYKNIFDNFITNHFILDKPYGYSRNKNPLYNNSYAIPMNLHQISDVRMVVKNVKANRKQSINNNGGDFWMQGLEEDRDSYGGENNTLYNYSEAAGGFVDFIPILNTTLSVANVKFDNFRDTQFWKNSTRKIEIDTVYYNPNNMKITYLLINLLYQPNGVTLETLNIQTFRLFLYQSNIDNARLALEIIYLLFYIYYFIVELVKIYNKITRFTMNQTSEEGATTNKAIFKIMGKFSSLKNKALQIFLGFKNHVSNIWTFLDILLIICGGIAISIWFDFATANSMMEQFPKVNYGPDLNREELKYINQMGKHFAEKIATYYTVASLVALIQTLKILRIVISFSVRLSNLLQLIMNVMDYLLFYLILMVTVFMSFVLLVNNYYGQGILEFSDAYMSTIYLLALMIGYNKKQEEMMKFDSNFTIFFFLLYYFIIVFILINFFLIIVKHEYQRLEKRTFEENKSKNKLDKFEYSPHLFVKIVEKIKNTLLQWSKYLFKSFYERRMHEEKVFFERLEIESMNHTNIEFDIDFGEVCSNNISEGGSSDFDDELISEHERLRRLRFRKIALVRLIWKSIFLILLFVFFVSLVLYNFDVENSFYGSQSVYNAIKRNNDSKPIQSFTKRDRNFNIDLIKDRASLYYYFSGVFFNCFEKKYFLQDISGLRANFSKQTNQSDWANITSDLPITYSLNNFNLLLHDKVRISIRRLNLIEQTLFPFKSYFPNFAASTFSYYQYSPSENKSDYTYSLNISTENEEKVIKYSEKSGYGNYGAYTFFLRPEYNYTKALIHDELYDKGFLNSTLNSFVVDFALINPFHDGKILYVVLTFGADDNGGVSAVTYFYQFQGNNVDSKFFVFVTFLRAVVLVGYVIMAISFFKSIYFKWGAYKTWHSMYIISYLPEALLYHRNRKKPEFIRMFWFVFDPNNLLNLLFFCTCGVLLILTVLQEALIFSLRYDSIVAGTRVYDMLNKNYKYSPASSDQLSDDSLQYFLRICYQITYLNDFQTVFASLSVFFLCLKIVYYWGKNKRFLVIIRAITYSLRDFPFILFLSFSFISAFAIFLYIYLGPNNEGFANIISCYTSLLQNLNHMSPSLYSYFMYQRDILGMLIIFVVFFICVKFVILNLFFSVVYRSYLQAKNKNLDVRNDNPDIGLREFFLITWESILFARVQQKTKQIELYLQSMTKDDFKRFYNQMKVTIKSSKDNFSTVSWASYCSEEIKFENMNRVMIKEKCDQILKEYRDETNIGNFSYFSILNRDPERKRAEYEIRLKYWNYFKTANTFLNKYDLYFKMKINRLIFELTEDKSKRESNKNNEYYDSWIRFYIYQLEERLEKNFQDIYQLRENYQNLLEEQI